MADDKWGKSLISEPKSVLDTDATAFLAGAGNQALFGLPQAIVEKLGGEQAVKDYIEKHKGAFEAGETVGTIGSGFIPIAGQVGRGVSLAGKVTKGVPLLGKALTGIGAGLEKTGAATRGFELIKRGAIEGALGEGLRGITSGEDVGQRAAQGAMFGGLGGTIGATLGGAGKLLGRAHEKAAEGTVAAALTGGEGAVPARVARKYLFERGPGSLGSKVGNKDELVADVARTASDNIGGVDLTKPFAKKDDLLAQWHEKVVGVLDDMDKAYQKAPEAIDNALINQASEIAANTARQFEGYGIPIDKLNAQLQDVLLPAISKPTLVSKRVALNQIINSSEKAVGTGNDIIDARYRAAVEMKKALTDATSQFAESLGNSVYPRALKEYGMIEGFFAPALIRAESKIGAAGTGSPTMEKLMTQMGMERVLAGEGAEGAVGNIGKIFASSMAGKAIAALAPAIQNRIGQASFKGLEKLISSPKSAEALSAAEKIQQYYPAMARGYAAARGEQQKQEQKEDEFEQIISAAKASENTESQQFINAIDRGIVDRWQRELAPIYGPASEKNNQFVEFYTGIYSALTDDGQKPIDKQKAAKVLFSDEAAQKKYLEAIKGVEAVDKNLNEALKASKIDDIPIVSGFINALPIVPGVINAAMGKKSDTNTLAAKSALVGAFADAAKKSGIPEKESRDILDKILSSGGTTAAKKRKILDAMRKFDPEGFEKLEKAGQ